MKRDKGAIEILCDEIGVDFINSYESPSVLISYISVLIDEIKDMYFIDKMLEKVGGKPPSSDSKKMLSQAEILLKINDVSQLISACREIHNTFTANCPYTDMLYSCVSALRFGLEVPCHSRHAASATGHIWKKKYGITLFDKNSNRWEKDWGKVKFYEALSKLIKIG